MTLREEIDKAFSFAEGTVDRMVTFIESRDEAERERVKVEIRVRCDAEKGKYLCDAIYPPKPATLPAGTYWIKFVARGGGMVWWTRE